MRSVRAAAIAFVFGCIITGLIAAGASAQKDAPLEHKERQIGDKAFLGVTWEANLEKGSLLVKEVHPGTPAWQCGLCPGDKILNVEAKKTTPEGKPTEVTMPAYPWLQIALEDAAPGTEIEFWVERGATSRQLQGAIAELEKERVEIPSASAFINRWRSHFNNPGWAAGNVKMRVKTASFMEFSNFHLRQQAVAQARLELARIQSEIERNDAQRKAALAAAEKALAQRDLALAQKKLAEAQQCQTGLSILGMIVQGICWLFGI